MIRSIIKRIIVGVSIALILGVIGSCEVKATSKDVVYTNFKTYYINSNDQETAINLLGTTNISFGLANYTRFAVSLPMMPSYMRGNVATADDSAFSSNDYFSFIVLTNDVQLTSALFINLRSMPCSVVNAGGLISFSDTSPRMYANIVECNTSGITNSFSSTGLHLYFNQPNTLNSGVNYIYLSNKYYFYDDPVSSKLQSVINLLTTTNSKLDIIDGDLDKLYTRLGTMNTTLSNILTKADSIFTRQLDAINQANTNSQQQTQAINNMNDTIKDDETSSVDTGAIGNASNNIASNNVISNLVLLPVNLFTKILDSSSAECQTFSLGTLYGEELKMPCISLSSYLGQSLVNVIDIIISGLFIYHISRKMVKIFEDLSSLRTGGNDV